MDMLGKNLFAETERQYRSGWKDRAISRLVALLDKKIEKEQKILSGINSNLRSII